MNIFLGETAQLYWVFKIRRESGCLWILLSDVRQSRPICAFSYRGADWVELAKPNNKRFSMRIERIPALDQPPAKAAIG
jgi:hypothetical protein